MRKAFVVLAMLSVAGCAGHRTGNYGLPHADRRTITAAELQQYGTMFSNLYDYVNSRHNDWLDNPPLTAAGRFDVKVYVDGNRFGMDPTALQKISLDAVALARRLTASEAEIKYGNDNNAGAIEVWTSLDRVE